MRFSAPLLDLSQARAIAPDTAQLQALVRSFDDSLATERARMDRAVIEGQAEALQWGLHALKGFMAMFCQPALAQAVTELYAASRQQPLDANLRAYTELAPVLADLQTEVRAWLGAL